MAIPALLRIDYAAFASTTFILSGQLYTAVSIHGGLGASSSITFISGQISTAVAS